MWEAAIGQHAEHGQQIGSSLAGSCLSDAHNVSSLQDGRDGVLLNRSRISKVHVVERIKDFIIKV